MLGLYLVIVDTIYISGKGWLYAANHQGEEGKREPHTASLENCLSPSISDVLVFHISDFFNQKNVLFFYTLFASYEYNVVGIMCHMAQSSARLQSKYLPS